MDRLSPSEAALLLSECDLVEERERLEGSLSEFVRGGWHVLEPGADLVWNWHLDTLCAYLEALFRREIPPMLIINIPPGTMKSLIVAVFYPAWCWIHDPSHRFLTGSNDEKLASRDSLRHRQLVESNWYQSKWGMQMVEGAKVDRVRVSKEQSEKTLWQNTQRGHRECQSVTGRITGKRGDTVMWDDPHDAEKTESAEQRNAVLNSWDGGWSSRLNDVSVSARILVMQRIHYQDCTAHWLKIYPEAIHLSIPMRYEGEPTFDAGKDLGKPEFNDPRTEAGELMFPAKFPEKAVKLQEGIFGPYRAAGQYQQRPSPKGGGEFAREDLMHWKQPPRGGNRYIIVDPAGEKKKTNLGEKRDNTAMIVVECAADQNYYVIDAYRDRLNLTQRADILFQWHRHYRPLGTGYEGDGFESDGAHIRDRMERENYRFKLIELRSHGLKKEDRVRKLLPLFNEHRIYLPERLMRTNFEGVVVDLVEQFIEQEYLPFPVGAFVDMMDVLSRITDPEMKIAFPKPQGTFRGPRAPSYTDPGAGY